jgi:hypothetical protein
MKLKLTFADKSVLIFESKHQDLETAVRDILIRRYQKEGNKYYNFSMVVTVEPV